MIRALVALALCLLPVPAVALPTMIRLGFTDCASCHVAPQDGGLLTAYGRGIDLAHSWLTCQYRGGRPQLFTDVRLVVAGAKLPNVDGAWPARVMSRTAVVLGSSTRIYLQMGLESSPNDPQHMRLVVSQAALELRPRPGVAFTAGRALLPSGLGVPDVTTFQRLPTNPSGTNYPLQVRAAIWSPRFELTPYVFGPGLDEPRHARQVGAGVVAGMIHGKLVAGLTARRSHSQAADRTSLGMYARLGFGLWGVLTEHEVTRRRGSAAVGTGYTQLFLAVRAWAVLSLIGDEVLIGSRRTVRVSPQAALRLSEHVTVILSTRQDVDTKARAWLVTMALKTTR